MTRKLTNSRKLLRRGLYTIMGFSLIFFIAIIVFRTNHDARHFLMDNREYVFTVDIFQHKAIALTQDQEEQHKTALSLVQKSIFSGQYFTAGSEMLQELADEGYAPSQTAHANLLLKVNALNNKHVAKTYYIKAANQGYKPAQEKLAAVYLIPF